MHLTGTGRSGMSFQHVWLPLAHLELLQQINLEERDFVRRLDEQKRKLNAVASRSFNLNLVFHGFPYLGELPARHSANDT